MSTIITPNIATFKEGEVYVYTLPEKEVKCNPSCDPNECDCNFKYEDHEKAVSYARAHPFKVAEKDKNKILTMIYANEYHSGRTSEQIVDYWKKAQDLIEYRIEGLRFEIKEVQSIYGDPLNFGFKQVACLIEDDGVKN